MKSSLRIYAALGVTIAVLLVTGYIGFLRYQVKDLKADKQQLELDLSASRKQVEVLSARESQLENIEVRYHAILQELKGKENGPVADVLRHAVGADVVR